MRREGLDRSVILWVKNKPTLNNMPNYGTNLFSKRGGPRRVRRGGEFFVFRRKTANIVRSKNETPAIRFIKR